MATAETISLLDAAAPVLSAIVWPAVLVTTLLLFRQPIRRLLRSDDLAVTLPGGVEVVAKRRAAASSIVEASREKSATPLDSARALLETGLLDDVVREQRVVRVLWVDDRPSNNREERAAFEKLGIVVDLSTSTDSALTMLSRSHVDLVISDMGQPEGERAGYDLLARMRECGDDTKLLFYASSRSPERFDEAVRRGALGCTNDPGELVEMVMAALRSRQARTGRLRVALRNVLRRIRRRGRTARSTAP